MGNKHNNRNHRNNHRHVFNAHRSRNKPNKHTKAPSTKIPRQRTAPSTSNSPAQNSETPAHPQHTVTIEGSRIINISKLQLCVSELTIHAAKCGSEMKVNGEIRHGLASIFGCSCLKCGHTINLETSQKVQGPRVYKRWECNLAAVWGQMCTGGGQTLTADYGGTWSTCDGQE